MRIAIVAAIMALAGCGNTESAVRQVGYFKSESRDRIFTAKMSKDATEQDARKFAERAAHTEGQMTAVYIFAHDAKAPADGITFAKSVFHANAILNMSGLSEWRYVFIRFRNGSAEFIDCATHKPEPCKQRKS